MKILYLKNRVIYTALLIIIILIIITILIFDIHTSHSYPDIDITHIEEKEIDGDNLIEIKGENERREILLQKYKEKKLIALTFDDGPSKYTEGLIDELKKRNVPATFFLLGENAQKFPSAIQLEVDAGNEIGIHSYKHNLFTKLTNNEINEQILLTKYMIFSEVDIHISLIRVPYGSINDRVNEVLKENHLTNILWTVDSKDWKFRNVTKIYNYVLKNIKGNDIILMHDIYSTSVKSATLLVDKLQSDGYVFLTVSELLEIENLAKN
ncbi:MAG: polysaccharide deacetylase family protein [Clostridia bacterium]|nr:polysaccharide deacetylase family protein [Clostridia bacterium]